MFLGRGVLLQESDDVPRGFVNRRVCVCVCLLGDVSLQAP